MIGRSTLFTGRPLARFVRSYGSSVEKYKGGAFLGWKRPSMDELPVPTKPWGPEMAKQKRKQNTMLILGLLAPFAVYYIGQYNPFQPGQWDLEFSAPKDRINNFKYPKPEEAEED